MSESPPKDINSSASSRSSRIAILSIKKNSLEWSQAVDNNAGMGCGNPRVRSAPTPPSETSNVPEWEWRKRMWTEVEQGLRSLGGISNQALH